jgi:hypothetical protein
MRQRHRSRAQDGCRVWATPYTSDEAMTKLIFNVKEPRGGSVLKSASGAAVHVAKPRGEAYLSKLGSGGVIERAAEARRKAQAA